MAQVGKLFNSVPYIVRDQECVYTDIPEVEEVINDFLSNYMLKIDNLVNVYSNNRDDQTNFHIKVNGNMPEESICVDLNHGNFDITFEEYKEIKTKSSKVNSLMFIEEFKHREENALVKSFEYMIGCDGKKLFCSIIKEKFNIYKPNSKAYLNRLNLLEKKDLVIEVAQSFNISIEDLYIQLNPNIIKQVCKDLHLTYKRLAAEIGYKPDTINKSASTGKISEQLKKAIEMYLENLRLKDEIKEFTIMKNTLNKILS
ncbi:MAG: hypothetical protein MJK08_11535 [Campylobacterales bacterium]|nr:hypothetical protein [Campylobacterales bacterium]